MTCVSIAFSHPTYFDSTCVCPGHRTMGQLLSQLGHLSLLGSTWSFFPTCSLASLIYSSCFSLIIANLISDWSISHSVMTGVLFSFHNFQYFPMLSHSLTYSIK
uniref:Uncharacterized protein n=1 Tax=Cacopsylla melanoneura TaxID=428564 RepID=A0A8D8ZBU9_9HEMI